MEIQIPSLGFTNISITDANLNQSVFNLVEELKINEFNIRTEFFNQPAKYVYWGSLLEQAKKQEEAIALEVSKASGIAFEQARNALIEEKILKPTQAQIEARLAMNAQVIQLNQNLNEARSNVRTLQTVVKAFEHRRDMLLQIGAEIRREKDYERKMNMGNL